MTKREFVERLTHDLLVAWMRAPGTSGNPPVGAMVDCAVKAWDDLEQKIPEPKFAEPHR